MTQIFYYLFYTLLRLFAFLPLPVLYLFSDVNYFIIRYLMRYRYKVVHDDLVKSYPHKSKREIRRIEHQFYLYLSDYFFELIKMLDFSPAQFKSRYVYENPEIISHLLENKKNVMVVFGHYGNWEWMCSSPLWFGNLANISTLYKPVKNKNTNKLLLKIRGRFGVIGIDKKMVFREMLKLRKLDRPYIMAFIADQTPSAGKIHYWSQFLNRDTAILTGWEELAIRMNDAVVYLDVKRVKRGYYRVHADLLSESPNMLDPDKHELTELFTRKMERTINENPAFWLWSHRRWKHHRTIDKV